MNLQKPEEMPKIPGVQGRADIPQQPVVNNGFVGGRQPDFMNNMGGGYSNQNQYATHQMHQQPQQVQQTAPRPQQVDTAQVFSPNSIPGFMRNGQ